MSGRLGAMLVNNTLVRFGFDCHTEQVQGWCGVTRVQLAAGIISKPSHKGRHKHHLLQDT